MDHTSCERISVCVCTCMCVHTCTCVLTSVSVSDNFYQNYVKKWISLPQNEVILFVSSCCLMTSSIL